MRMKFLPAVFTLLLVVPANGAEVSKGAWIKGMMRALPAAFCKDKMYFRQCFEVSQQDCIDVAALATESCLEQISSKLPEILVQPKDGAKFGRTVGGCAGQKYEQALKSRFTDTARCRDVNNWR